MTKELYAEVVGQLFTAIALAKDEKEKERLSDLCKRVVVAASKK